MVYVLPAIIEYLMGRGAIPAVSYELDNPFSGKNGLPGMLYKTRT